MTLIANILINVCILVLLVIAFKKKDKKLFLTACAIYGFMDIYWSLPLAMLYRYYGIPLSYITRMEGGFIHTTAPYFNTLLGILLLTASYFLYHGNRWAYYFIRAYFYFLGFIFAIICPVGIVFMAYYIFIKHADFPILARIPGTCNSLVTICIIIFSIKFLNLIRPKPSQKTKRSISDKAVEEISCPECGNIIPPEKDICSKCNWTYHGENEA